MVQHMARNLLRTPERNRIIFQMGLNRGGIIQIGENMYDLAPEFKALGGKGEGSKGYDAKKETLSQEEDLRDQLAGE